MLSIPDLQGLLADRRGAQFVSFTARTDARLNKTGNPFVHAGVVWKICRVNGVVNFRYAGSVNRQRVREAEASGTRPDLFEMFRPKPRRWGVRLRGLPFVQHRGRVYLEIKIERTSVPRFEDAAGNELTLSQVEPFQPPRTSNAAWQGVESEIVLRDYELAHIVEITFAGETHVLDHSTAAMPMAGVA